MSGRGQGPVGLEAVGSVAVHTFEARQSPTPSAPQSMDGQHVNAMAGDRSGDNTTPTSLADYEELPQGHFYDPDAEYEPDPEYAATLAPDAARQRRERIGPTGRPLPYFPIPGPLTDHGPAKIIAMCNQKGGVGKTTSTINLGAALAEYGRRVLLVDFDPQGALSVGLGVNPMELDLTVYNLLMERGMSADEVLLKTAVPNMDLLPSNIDLSAAEVQLVSEVARESTLQRALKPLMADYDYIVIDCQPSLGLLTVNALTAAHKVIVPLECEFFALRGVALLTETIEKVQERLNPDLELDGILATMYDSRTVHSREVLARVVEAFDDHVYHTVIGRTVRFPETTVAGEPITTYASNSVGAAAYRQLAREVLARCHAE
ncbi:ParA family protein [Streptomyces spectabilis]|uniref:ParA family protein n=1 Tax=Streptomyces spectabilis TaxID=68270 RepID=A0A516R509_STRST|nr:MULTISPECIES: ParA family protein [Streptomyces]MCI3901660.1 ParA family protein [Streptomyces spectabilis]QDQ10739.1 ParA family protein [Streptomyces spectabilis]QEV59101.1 ParA family protein [Streptomyces spectabilis]